MGFSKSCKKRTFHLSLVMPSVLGQSGAEVILHMAHSLLSAGNVSFEILERGKVIFNKLKSGAPKASLQTGWVSICFKPYVPFFLLAVFKLTFCVCFLSLFKPSCSQLLTLQRPFIFYGNCHLPFSFRAIMKPSVVSDSFIEVNFPGEMKCMCPSAYMDSDMWAIELLF